MTEFASVDEMLEHASGKLALEVTAPMTPATVRIPGHDVEAWELLREARRGEEGFTFQASALEDALCVSTLDDDFYDRVADFRRRIPAIPEVPKGAKVDPSWALHFGVSSEGIAGISSSGGHPDVIEPQRHAIEDPLSNAEAAFRKFLADPDLQDKTTAANQVRAYRRAAADHTQARQDHTSADAAYESAKQAFTQSPSRASAVTLRAALVKMKSTATVLDAAESAYDRARPPYDVVRAAFYAAASARSFVNQEGNIDAIATWDRLAFTWGIGFSNSAGIPRMFKALYERAPVAGGGPDSIRGAAAAIRKVMHAAGYVVQPRNDGGGRYLFVDVGQRRVRNFDHNDNGGLTAFLGGKLVPQNRALLNLLAFIARDKKTRPAVVWMMIEMSVGHYTNNGVWAKHLATLSAYGFFAKMRHSLVPSALSNSVVEYGVRRAWAGIERDETARQEKDRKFDWETYEKCLKDAIAAGDPVDPGAQASLGTGGRVGNYRKRRPELEPPSKERDIASALGGLQFLCHCYELTRLASAQRPAGLLPNDPKLWAERKVGEASGVYTQFLTAWFHQQGARHWEQWIDQKPGKDALSQIIRLDAAVPLRDHVAQRYPEAMVSPVQRVESTPRGAELSTELARREALRAPLLQKQKELTQQLEEENANPAARSSQAHDWHEAELLTVSRDLTVAEGPSDLHPPKDRDHDWPATALSWEALTGEYKILYDKALAETRGYYFVNSKSGPAMSAKSAKPDLIPIGRCDEIWEFWPQAAEQIVAQPLHARPNLFEIRYTFLGEAKKDWMTVVFDGGMPKEPRREEEPGATAP